MGYNQKQEFPFKKKKKLETRISLIRYIPPIDFIQKKIQSKIQRFKTDLLSLSYFQRRYTCISYILVYLLNSYNIELTTFRGPPYQPTTQTDKRTDRGLGQSCNITQFFFLEKKDFIQLTNKVCIMIQSFPSKWR